MTAPDTPHGDLVTLCSVYPGEGFEFNMATPKTTR